ncbi:uncharacterized protein N7479_003097 [Penicillium vulpinum]|uniref:uncharacterized protein n=1 Tax=Penicillium vulpinum TaxID=29845 RepID=UPI0025467000|nr:uncharacterized protein N7479_003097 [Penicillium vulpinum]KAJ5963221.1 hypothetical protein N7479_003097 [Penicillium vulpinum]
MDGDNTNRDLFPALLVQLCRETSGTPSIPEEDSQESIEPGSPTPRPHTSLTTDDNQFDREPVLPVPDLHSLPSGSESKTSNSSSSESPRQNTRSHQTTTQVQFALGDSSQYLPTASHIVSSRDTPQRPYEDVTPIATPRIKFGVNKRPRETTPDSSTSSDSANTEGPSKDATRTTPPIKLKLVLKNRPREATPDLSTGPDSGKAEGPSKDVTRITTPRIKFVFNKRPRQSTLESIPLTVPSGPISREYPSSPTKPGIHSSNIDSNQLRPIENTSAESSFIPEFSMDPSNSSAFSTSHESSSDHDEASTSINPTSELPATGASPSPRSSSDKAPFGYSGYPSDTLDFVPSTPLNPADSLMGASIEPSVDPYQPSDSAVMPDITPFGDPNVLPSTFIYPEEAHDYSDWVIDPMGVYYPGEYGRILASEQEVLHQMADPHTDNPTHMCGRAEELPLMTIADMDRVLSEIDAATEGMESLQPGYWNSIGPPRPYLIQPSIPDVDGSVRAQYASAQAASPSFRETSEVPTRTLQSVEEAGPGSTTKRARYSSPKTKSSSPELSTTVSTRTSVLVQRRSASSRIKTMTPSSTSTSTRLRSKNQPVTPAPTSASSRRRSKGNIKTEIATPEPQVTVSPRRLRSADVNPSSSTKKIGKGNATPESWETAPIADKMMSQMKETASSSWMDITTAWNENRNVDDDEMTWRALSKRWGRIKDKIGVWPGFDDVLLNTIREFESELDDDGFGQIARDVSTEIGWEIPSTVCQSRYNVLKESGKVNVKGKGRARK